jgi:hypothetical protein
MPFTISGGALQPTRPTAQAQLQAQRNARSSGLLAPHPFHLHAHTHPSPTHVSCASLSSYSASWRCLRPGSRRAV